MGQKRKIKSSNNSISPYQVLRVDDIPEDVPFSHMLSVLSYCSRRIVGCARIADYTAKRLGESVFFICTSKQEAKFLESLDINFLEEGHASQQLYWIDSVPTSAKLADIYFDNRYTRKPIGVHLKKLQRQHNYENATLYLRSLAIEFERKMSLTYLRLNYDIVTQATRSDGFLAFMSLKEAKSVGGEGAPIIHEIHGQQIEAYMSLSTPVFIDRANETVLERGQRKWCREIEEINQLCFTHPTPFVHKRKEFNAPSGCLERQPQTRSPIRPPQPAQETERSPIRPPQPAQDVEMSPIRPPQQVQGAGISCSSVVQVAQQCETIMEHSDAQGTRRTVAFRTITQEVAFEVYIPRAAPSTKASYLSFENDTHYGTAQSSTHDNQQPSTSRGIRSDRKVFNLSRMVNKDQEDVPSSESDSDYDRLVIHEDEYFTDESL